MEGLTLQPYQVLVTIEVLQMERPNPVERHRILSFIRNLATNPDNLEIIPSTTNPIASYKSKSSVITL